MTDKQCPSCGGNCGRTVKSGCLYNSPVERKALRVTANAQQAEIESLRQRVAELESLGRISEKQIIIGLEARLAACEKERDELFEAMQHPSYEVENDLRAKNQNLFNALMNSTAYSDSLNEQIKRARGHMNLYRLFSCEGGDSYDPECAEKNLDKVMEILSETYRKGGEE